MRTRRALSGLLLTLALTACDSQSANPEGGLEDGGSDVAMDAEPRDATVDAAVEDAEPDIDTASVSEICDDGIDNDGDGLVDCEDSECSRNPEFCLQPEICGDAVDNDLDGHVDCDDDDCCASIACEEGCWPRTCQYDPSLCNDDESCNTTGECIPTVDIDTYEPAEDWSYISEIFIAGNDAPETTCCFDLDGDGLVDNGLGTTLVPLLASLDSDLNELLAEQLEEDTVSLLVEYREFPESGTGPGAFHFWFGEGIDGSAGLEGYSTRASGDGAFRVNADAFATDLGSYVQLNQLDVIEFVAMQEDAIIMITFDASSLLAGVGEISLAIRKVQFEATLDATDPRFSVNNDFGGLNIGGAKLGGYLNLDELFSQVDDALSGCTCAAELDGDTPVVTYGDARENGRNYSVSCGENAYDVSACTEEADGQICTEFLNTICGFVPYLSSIPLADIDTNGNGVPDAISVGFFLSMVSANVDPENWIAVDTD